ncbi:ankyrin repeat domain-containing protein 27-like [Scylla paramamosain]|uniref:ankyrin repeat domain-containing protein 27-like n=1 Tax=Scylla paramamosain TaxID=85552 RepID=UPI003082E356
MEDYDEDLSENSFFAALTRDHRALLEQAAADGWLLCVPRAQAAPAPPLEDAVVQAHVLVPCEDDPDTRFRTLGGRGASLEGSVLVVEGQQGAPRPVRVLFDETFYEEELGRYKVVCVEEALHEAGRGTGPAPLAFLTSLRDCVELLWAEAGGSRGLARLDALLAGFQATHPLLEGEEVTAVREAVGELYCEALQVAVEEGQGRGGAGLGMLGLAVESYLLHSLHARLVRCLATHRAPDDARFNHALKALCDLQPGDLGLPPVLAGSLTRATLELSGLADHTTPLGKIGCLKRAVAQLGREAGPLTSDQLLPALVVVVVRTGLPSWPAQLAFLRLFRFSAAPVGGGEHDFYLSSLEAALQHVASGALLGPACPEADSVLRCASTTEAAMACSPSVEQDPCMRYFECVRQGLVEEVQALLDGHGHPHKGGEGVAVEEGDAELCHPLCRCERCEGMLHQPQEHSWPCLALEDSLGRTALHLACMFGRPAVVDLLVGRGAALGARDQRGASPLHYAAQRGHQNALLLLLHAGADINATDGEQNTALHLAALHGHLACVKALLFYAESVGHHVEINGQNTALDTPLHLAARWGHLAIVELLLDRLVALGLPLALTNRRRLTAIECAHNQLIVRAILDARSRAPTPDAPGRARSRLAAVAVPHSPTTHLDGPGSPQGRGRLEASRANADKMLKAVRVGDERLACFYLGIDYDTVAPQTAPSSQAAPTLCHPLCQCAQCVAKAPPSLGTQGAAYTAPINACDRQGRTALHEAVAGGHPRLARLLLQHGADPNVQTLDQGLTPLHLAVRSGHTELLADLARHGAALDLADTLGNTALHMCCASGQGEAAGQLLRLGASQGLSNLASRSPIQEAEEYGHWRVVEVLLGRPTPQ